MISDINAVGPLLAARSQLSPRKGAFFLLGCLLSLVLVNPAFALQHELPRNIDIQFTRITGDDGMSSNAPKSIIQDSQGFIWIGTQQGLNRFDG